MKTILESYSIKEILDIYTKNSILNFFNNRNNFVMEVSSGVRPIKDVFENRDVDYFRLFNRNVPLANFYTNDFFWTSSDIYHFEKYNLKLNNEFKEYVLSGMYEEEEIKNEYDGRPMILNETPEEREAREERLKILEEEMSKYQVDTTDL